MNTPEQRWGSAPAEIPIRTALHNWSTPERNAVHAFMIRQNVMEVVLWIRERVAHYQAALPNEKTLRLWHEAALDVLAWQRRMDVAAAAQWVVGWERNTP
jgi:hypothetical protein